VKNESPSRFASRGLVKTRVLPADLSFFSYTACPNALIVVRSRITAVNIFAFVSVLLVRSLFEGLAMQWVGLPRPGSQKACGIDDCRLIVCSGHDQASRLLPFSHARRWSCFPSHPKLDRIRTPTGPGKSWESTKNDFELPADYTQWLSALKRRIRGARQRALLSVNQEQIRLYHEIGQEILDRQRRQGWGAKVIERLSFDLRAAFPNMKGLSASSLKYMRFFAAECPDRRIGQQSADQLPWFHIVTLSTKLRDPALREWYAREAVVQSWPRETLNLQIRDQLHLRKGAAVTNFELRLARRQAGLANQILKDPYHFDFLGLGAEAHEHDIENALMRHITRFLLELGFGFAFVGRQFRLEIGGDEFFIDLLFYHTRLKCYPSAEAGSAGKHSHTGTETVVIECPVAVARKAWLL
jgi:predicted nuclease of restriction endonuclease-like (RecB) superfamily